MKLSHFPSRPAAPEIRSSPAFARRLTSTRMAFSIAIPVLLAACLCPPAHAQTKAKNAPVSYWAGQGYRQLLENYVAIAVDSGRDVYGPVKSPVFVDVLNAHTRQPYRWRVSAAHAAKERQPREQIMASLSIAEPLHALLREMSRLTGESRYAATAEEAARFALQHHVHENGLGWWGNHSSWDALSDRGVGLSSSGLHEMKSPMLDYAWLGSLNPDAIKTYIEQVWHLSISNWPRLVWGRHMSYIRPHEIPWEKVDLIDKNQKVPFEAPDSSYMGSETMQNLVRSGYYYAHLTGDARAREGAF